MIWSFDQFEGWFDGYHASDAAFTIVVAVATQNDIEDLADDLHAEWRLSVRTAVDRLRSRGRSFPVWLLDEDAATRYSVRILTNDALDLGRIKMRASAAFHSLARRSTWASEPVEPALIGPVGDGSGPLESMARELGVMLEAGVGGCPGCTSVQTVSICMGVVERLRFPDSRSHHDSGAEEAPSVRDENLDDTDWQSSVSTLLPEMLPSSNPLGSLVPGTVVAPSGQQRAARQVEQRCGTCAVSLLERLAAALSN